jgi:hypothetical protein
MNLHFMRFPHRGPVPTEERILLNSRNQQRRTGWVMEMRSNLVPNPVRLGNRGSVLLISPPAMPCQVQCAVSSSGFRVSGLKRETRNSKLLFATDTWQVRCQICRFSGFYRSIGKDERIFRIETRLEVKETREGVATLLRPESNLMHPPKSSGTEASLRSHPMWAKSAMEVSGVAYGRWRIEDGARHKGERKFNRKEGKDTKENSLCELCVLCG